MSEYYLDEKIKGSGGELGRAVGNVSVTGTADVTTRFSSILSANVTLVAESNIYEDVKIWKVAAGVVSIHVMAWAGAGTPGDSGSARVVYFDIVGKEEVA